MEEAKIKEILKHEADSILNLPVDDNYNKAIDLIVNQVNKKGGKLVTSGMGKAGRHHDGAARIGRAQQRVDRADQPPLRRDVQRHHFPRSTRSAGGPWKCRRNACRRRCRIWGRVHVRGSSPSDWSGYFPCCRERRG